MTELPEPEPTGLTKAKVFRIAEAFADEVEFFPGDRLEPLIEQLGGTVTYLRGLDSIEAEDGSLHVWGPEDFEIKVSAFTGPVRDRFTIAHELGHFVLHSDRGQKPIKAARFGSNRVEWEANWFAAAFLMPEEAFRKVCAKYDNDPDLVAAHFVVSSKAAEVRMQALEIS